MATINPQIINGVSVPELNFSTSVAGGNHFNYDYYWVVNAPLAAIWFYSNTTLYLTIASPSPTATYHFIAYYPRYPQIDSEYDGVCNQTYSYNGQTVYYYVVNVSPIQNIQNDLPLLPNINPNYTTYPVANGIMAWAMIYGDTTPDGYNVTYDLVGCVGNAGNPIAIPPNATVTTASFTPDDSNPDIIYTFNSGSVWIDGDGASQGIPVVFNWDYETGHLRIGIVSSDITVHVHAYGDPYADIDGESELPGGGSVGVPGLPGLTAVSSGVIGLFSPTPNQMKLLSDFMWTDFGGTGSTEVDVLKEIVQAIKRLVSNPLDYIVGLNIIPSQGLSIGSAQEIRFGFVNSGVSMPRLTNQYFTVDCGSLNFDTVCGDTFLDYAPYSKFSIYLPYIGVKDVDANDFVGHTISVLYRGDVVTGGVTAYILKDGSVMYQYSGCCALTVPLSADSWGTTISGAVQIATSIVAGAVSGGAAGAAMSAAKGAASVASNPSMLSPQVAHSGAVSGSAGCMGVQYPFVIREAVRFHSTVGMNTVSGYPSYYYKKLSTVHGYTEVLDVHLNNIPATDGEIAEIETLLKGGVIL